MADRSFELSKKSLQNHKKKKNKSSKRKGSNFSPKKSDKLDSPRNKNKTGNLHLSNEFSEDKYDNLSEKNNFYISEREYSKTNDIKHIVTSPKREKYEYDFVSTGSIRSSVRESRVEERQIYYVKDRLNDRRNSCNKSEFFDNGTSHGTSHSPESVEDLLQRVDYLTNQVDTLTQENLRLNDALYDIQYNWTVLTDSEVDIVFKKKELSEKFSIVLRNLVSNLLNGNISIEELNKFGSSKEEKSIKLPEPDCLFALDCSADPDESGNTSIPRYDASFQEILQSPGETKSSSPPKFGRFEKCCYNCGEKHHLRDCTYKLDYRKIEMARKQRPKSNYVSSLRYHVHGKNESDFKPGVISDELREALSLQVNQIPSYVYCMRVLDYPPGWLSEAEVESSGITLYGSDGNAQRQENCEDGEVDTTGIRVQYDPEKLIDYPGFNVPLPPDITDESFDMGLPPLQTQQLRCFTDKSMSKLAQPSRKRKPTFKDDRPLKIQRSEEDMEIEENSDDGNEDSVEFESDFVPPLPEFAPPPPPPPPSPPPLPPGEDSEISEDVVLAKFTPDSPDENSFSALDHFRIKSCTDFSSGTSSPSLAELEEIKKKLVLELGIGLDDTHSSNASRDNESVELSEDKNSEENYIIEDEFIASENSNESNISESSSTLNKTSDSPETPEPLQRTGSKSKFMTLGTPSLSSHSSFSKLPEYEKFSENVSSHIPFENLPNSTGTYLKMKNVLKKVKDKLNSLMQ